MPAARVVAFYSQRGTAEQYIKEGKIAVKWTRLSCRTMKANAARLQLHALAYNLGNFLRTLALPAEMESWSLTTIREKVVKIGAKVIAHARYAVFQMAEVAVRRDQFRRILDLSTVCDHENRRHVDGCGRPRGTNDRRSTSAPLDNGLETSHWGRSWEPERR